MTEAATTDTGAALVVPEDWHIHYDYSAGPIVGHFLRGLAEERIEGRRCPRCGMVWLPPRGYCERCFVATDAWVPVGPEGALEAFTIVGQKFENLPDPPYVIAFCRLDGADTALVNFLRMPLEDIEAAARQLRPGTRVRACFKEQRAARITDFHYELL
jgi:uncharacterized OB-fold protein